MIPKQPHHIEPGAGALAYARERLSGLSRDQAASVIRELIVNLPEEKRVKRCVYCLYPFRDGSLRNNRITCCDECDAGKKTLQKRRQRADKALLAGEENPKRQEKVLVLYTWWLEYPYWINHYEMIKRTWKYEVPHKSETLDFISGQRQI